MLKVEETFLGGLVTTWKCDKCGKTYVKAGRGRLRLPGTLEANINVEYTYTSDGGTTHTISMSYELCDKCTQEFMNAVGETM